MDFAKNIWRNYELWNEGFDAIYNRTYLVYWEQVHDQINQKDNRNDNAKI